MKNEDFLSFKYLLSRRNDQTFIEFLKIYSSRFTEQSKKNMIT